MRRLVFVAALAAVLVGAEVASAGVVSEGLTHSGNTFVAAYEVGNTTADPTDIQLTTFTP
jgi:hypothetical protein